MISTENQILIKNLWESKGMWPPNSPDLSPVDYAIWSVIQQRVYETGVHDIDELQLRLLHVWHGVEQSLIDDS